ncbi:hypothetical protein HDU97_008378 [Phlyctochytrium planicorne]|nr:hypothetical protein HDU97_008378 [Phlyctochytrium planicorne]
MHKSTSPRLSLETLAKILKPYTNTTSNLSPSTCSQPELIQHAISHPQHLSLHERFRIAVDLWNDREAHVPRKAVMILEWVNSAMLNHQVKKDERGGEGKGGVEKKDKKDGKGKGGAKGKQGKDVDGDGDVEMSEALEEYWQTMDEILSHLASTRKIPGTHHVNLDMDLMDMSSSLPNPTSIFNDHDDNDDSMASMDVGDTTIRIPGFIPIVASLIETVTQRSKLAPPPSLDVPSRLLNFAHSCLRSLLAKSLVHDVLRPTMDLYVALVAQLLDALAERDVAGALWDVRERTLDGEMDGCGEEVELVKLALTAVAAFHDSITMSPNQKKVFGLIASNRLLYPLLKVQTSLSRFELQHDTIFFQRSYKVPSSQPASIQDACQRLRGFLTLLLDDGLFHQDHIPDLVGVVKQILSSALVEEDVEGVGVEEEVAGKKKRGDGKKKDGAVKWSYPKRLFDLIRDPLKSPDNTSLIVVESLPILLDRLLAVRAFRSMHAQATAPLETEAFSFGFSVFSILHSFVSSSTLASSSPSNLFDPLVVTSRMLERLLKRNVYRRSRDASSAYQLGVLNRVCHRIVGGIEEQNRNGSDASFGSVFDALTALLGIEMNVVMERLEHILPVLVERASSASAKERTKFFCSLIQTASKAHELDQLLVQVLTLPDTCGKEFEFGTYLFEREVQQRLSSCISRALPAEARDVISRLATILGSIPMSLTTYLAHKRQAPSSGGGFPRYASSLSPGTANLCATFLASLLTGATGRNTGVDTAIESLLDQIHDSYTRPCLEAWEGMKDAEKNLKLHSPKNQKKRPSDDIGVGPDGLNVSQFIIAGLEVLLASIQVSESFWRKNVSTMFVEKVLMLAGQVDDPRCEYLKVRIALLHVDLVANTSVDPRLDDGSMRIMAEVLSASCKSPPTGVESQFWDGDLVGLIKNPESLPVALWSAVLDNLAPICRLAPEDQLETVTEVVLCNAVAIESQKSTELLSIPRLCRSALKSATFYELRPIRDVFVGVFLTLSEKLVNQAQGLDDGFLKSLVSVLVKCREDGAVSERVLKELNALSPKVSKVKVVSKSMPSPLHQAVQRIMRLVGMLSIFPMSYFHPSEKDILQAVGRAIDCLGLSLIDKGYEMIGMEVSAVSRAAAAQILLTREESSVMTTFTALGALSSIFESKFFDEADLSSKQVIADATCVITETAVGRMIRKATLPRASDEDRNELLAFLDNAIRIPILCLKHNSSVAANLKTIARPKETNKATLQQIIASYRPLLKQLKEELSSIMVASDAQNLDQNFNFTKSQDYMDAIGLLLTIGHESNEDIVSLAELMQLLSRIIADLLKETQSKELDARLIATGCKVFSVVMTEFAFKASTISDADLFCLFETGRCLAGKVSTLGTRTSSEHDIGEKMLKLLSIASREQYSLLVTYYLESMRKKSLAGGFSTETCLSFLYIQHVIAAASQLEAEASVLISGCTLLLFSASPTQLSSPTSSTLLSKTFDMFCRVLLSMLTHRRVTISHVIPAVSHLVATLMECLREPLSADLLHLQDRFKTMTEDQKTSLAKTVSRLLQKFSQKQGFNLGDGQNGGTSQLKPFSKHATFIVSRFVSVQASKTRFSTAVWDCLLEGIYSVLDICDDFGRESILANMDLPGTGQKGAKLMYKKIISDWKAGSKSKSKV